MKRCVPWLCVVLSVSILGGIGCGSKKNQVDDPKEIKAIPFEGKKGRKDKQAIGREDPVKLPTIPRN